MEIREIKNVEELHKVLGQVFGAKGQGPMEQIKKSIEDANKVRLHVEAVDKLFDKMGATEGEVLETLVMMVRDKTNQKKKSSEFSARIEEHKEELAQDMFLVGMMSDVFETTDAKEIQGILASTLSAITICGDKFVKDAIQMMDDTQEEHEGHECTNCGACGKEEGQHPLEKIIMDTLKEVMAAKEGK